MELQSVLVTSTEGNFAPNPITLTDTIGSEYIYVNSCNASGNQSITASSGVTIINSMKGNGWNPSKTNACFGIHFRLTAANASITFLFAGSGHLIKIK